MVVDENQMMDWIDEHPLDILENYKEMDDQEGYDRYLGVLLDEIKSYRDRHPASLVPPTRRKVRRVVLASYEPTTRELALTELQREHEAIWKK